jgi:hypothetical protein
LAASQLSSSSMIGEVSVVIRKLPILLRSELVLAGWCFASSSFPLAGKD